LDPSPRDPNLSPDPTQPNPGGQIWIERIEPSPSPAIARWPDGNEGHRSDESHDKNSPFGKRLDLPPLQPAGGRAQEFELATTPRVSPGLSQEFSGRLHTFTRIVGPAPKNAIRPLPPAPTSPGEASPATLGAPIRTPVVEVSLFPPGGSALRSTTLHHLSTPFDSDRNEAASSRPIKRVSLDISPRLIIQRANQTIETQPDIGSDEATDVDYQSGDVARPSVQDGASTMIVPSHMVSSIELDVGLPGRAVAEHPRIESERPGLGVRRSLPVDSERLGAVDAFFAACVGVALQRFWRRNEERDSLVGDSAL